MPSWPTTLPAPLLSSYEIKSEPTFIRTNMDSGKARQRSRYTKARSMISPSFLMTQLQLAIFEAWWEHQINNGASFFDMVLVNGKGAATYSVRFTQSYQFKKLSSGLYNVSTELEVYGLNVMTPTELAQYL